MKTVVLTILSLVLIFGSLKAQVYSNKEVGKKNQEKADSIKKTEYPYVLPIWGKKAAAKGFALPYSAGVNINYFWQESDLVIDNLSVGFNNGPMYNIDEIIRMDNAVSTANAISLRPDIWVFPFLNVYGIFSKAKTSTAIDASVWIPKDSTGVFQQVGSFSTIANFDVNAAGFGMTPTVGVAGGWLALDMNVLWSDVSALDKPVFTFVFGPRLGKTFNFKKRDRNIAFWVGGFRVKFSSETKGSLYLDELIPTDGLQAKVDNGIIKVDEAYNNVENWWTGLSDLEQLNPINKAKYEAANRALGTAGRLFTDMDAALNDGDRASVQYSLEKSLASKWNIIVGTQFQYNKHFMIRAEYGFLSTRHQILTGLQYRFGL